MANICSVLLRSWQIEETLRQWHHKSTLCFDGIKTVLYLFVLSHFISINRVPLNRKML